MSTGSIARIARGGALLTDGGARDGGLVALDVEHAQHAQRVVGADRRVLGRHLDHDGRLAVRRLDVDLAAVGRRCFLAAFLLVILLLLDAVDGHRVALAPHLQALVTQVDHAAEHVQVARKHSEHQRRAWHPRPQHGKAGRCVWQHAR